MRFAIIQLSDIHFRATSNVLVSRLEKIIAAIRPTIEEVHGLVFAVTGDIAMSGSNDEYQVASNFFTRLRESILEIDPAFPIQFVFIPGNHDCDFRSANDLRPALSEGLSSKIATLDPRGEIVQRMIEVQKNFFSFEAGFQGNTEIPVLDRLRYQVKVSMGSHHITFDCYNTAWMSQKDENQGTLLFPLRLLSNETSGDEVADLTVSLLHHRDNWLEAGNARLLRDYVESHSDLILSGHEHIASAYRKTKFEGAAAQYVEGAVLQDFKNPGDSGFNVMEFDLDNGLQKLLRFRWGGQRYSTETSDEWCKFERNVLLGGQFQLTSAFLKQLRDPGTGFIHPAKPDLTLDDFFVYPDLRRRSFERLLEKDGSPRLVKGEGILEFVNKSKRVLVSGADDSGKTSLAHMLYLDLRQHYKLIPVSLSGKEIHGKNPEAALKREIKEAIKDQYSGDVLERHTQTGRHRKVLIVDDWHKIRYNPKGQMAFLEAADKKFDSIICFVDDLFSLERLTATDERPFERYEICEIKEFGHLRRGELIRKWQSLGSDYSEQQADFAHNVAAIEATVNTVIGKNLLPSYPVIVLVILQAYETTRGSNTSAGSYGQMYEALITTALALVSKKAVDLGTKYTYLSRMAYYVFTRNKHELEVSDLDHIHKEYEDQYRIKISGEVILEQFETAQIICRHGDTVYFKYKYIYCYFVAKYFQDNIANLIGAEELKTQLRDVADKVYVEDYMNIIIFYVYLTKDRELIQYLLANADRIYHEHEPCDLTVHVEFVNRLGTDTRELVLPPTDPEQNRQNALRQKDEAEEVEAVTDEEVQVVKYDDKLADVLKINIALKNLRILGQILRNFPGALKADLKLDLTRASYQLGLRTLRAILLIAETDIDGLRGYIARLLRERRALEDKEELAEETDRVVISLTRNIAFGLIKRISYAVGLEELEETYKTLLESDGSRLPVRVIDYAIKLDHFSKFPNSELHDIVGLVRKNAFALRLVRDLTADYLYLFPAEFRVRQQIGKLLNIKISPQLIGSESKKLKELPAANA